MILSESLTDVHMADVAGCSDRTIRAIRSNLKCFGTTKIPQTVLDDYESLFPRGSKPSVTTYLKIRDCIRARWRNFYGRNSEFE